ncbi:pentatricopeptide repeat-containing protein [Gossypium australe]|uniref:Pentatricopeptide repeat-containing protein n=1 Tax=Gossypium australe TaxID=47621 RepID=A0A5B6UX91_9ROSI|nr:pentatricopeptide repeat-containing protein [Gossypium australe]
MTPITLSPTKQLSLELNATQTLPVLERCSTMEELKQIHAQMLKTGLVADTVLVSKVLTFCVSSKYGNLEHARMVFDRVNRPNTFMYNTMIKGYSENNKPETALLLYQHMLDLSVPQNSYTFPFLLKACSSLSAMEETKQIHAHVVKLGFASEVYAVNSLLHVYASSGSMEAARLLFDQVLKLDVVSWNLMIDGYAKCGKMETAYEFFKNMPTKNVISWTTMISGYVGAGMYKEALNLFQEMQIEGVKPDKVALASTLSACSYLGALDQGRWIHAYIDKIGIVIDPILGCALTDMYAKCGDMEEALEVFKKQKKKEVALWTALIYGFAIHGRGREALDWFETMQKVGIKPNHVTFTAILTACSYSRLVDKGKSLFESIERVHKLRPRIEHYGCMVDLLGRAGLLEEAKGLIELMPVKPNAVVWGALLNACRIHKNVELGTKVGKLLVEEDPDHGGRYVHLASIHAAAGNWDQAVEARRKMKERGVSKLPGCSAISLNGVVHEFLAGTKSHPQAAEIYRMWDNIAERLEKEGYKPALQNLLLDLDNEAKEMAINQHSEKLAIAFGLLRTKPGTTIRIIKNLRICEDCHTVTKLVSKIYDREIVMRDRTRFHHFKDGNCTCGDKW